ncbi:MAG TPA: type II toxin-antitoxin system prevent-host-death family antitoxin [bacterium]|nr:type II toxin-antitoxin system prevent-host-death family antitoxin [bacterium]HQO35438.1 type II toxin-antitoxin system prevent-host-death family antitoxin [bacterium]HQQ00587.1 type II toxin-antitoxin system prevent-host-death family antitoxin [bacterium]
MNEISTSDIRKDLSDAINRVLYSKERITLNRHGKKVAALVPVEDAELLEILEEESDLRAARAAMREKGKNLTWKQMKRELGIEK